MSGLGGQVQTPTPPRCSLREGETYPLGPACRVGLSWVQSPMVHVYVCVHTPRGHCMEPGHMCSMCAHASLPAPAHCACPSLLCSAPRACVYVCEHLRACVTPPPRGCVEGVLCTVPGVSTLSCSLLAPSGSGCPRLCTELLVAPASPGQCPAWPADATGPFPAGPGPGAQRGPCWVAPCQGKLAHGPQRALGTCRSVRGPTCWWWRSTRCLVAATAPGWMRVGS